MLQCWSELTNISYSTVDTETCIGANSIVGRIESWLPHTYGRIYVTVVTAYPYVCKVCGERGRVCVRACMLRD